MDTSNDKSTADAGRTLMTHVRESATAQLITQKDRATDSLGSLARAVRDTSQPLRNNQQEAIAQYVERAADQIERFSTRLRERDIKELFNDVQGYARRQPAVFIGAAFAAGLLAARFLKSSSESRRDGAISDSAYGYRDRGEAAAYSSGKQPRSATGGL